MAVCGCGCGFRFLGPVSSGTRSGRRGSTWFIWPGARYEMGIGADKILELQGALLYFLK